MACKHYLPFARSTQTQAKHALVSPVFTSISFSRPPESLNSTYYGVLVSEITERIPTNFPFYISSSMSASNLIAAA